MTKPNLLFVYLICLNIFFLNGQETTYGSQSDVSSRTIDQSLPVFSIPDQISISNGSVSYSIPINVPAGINGMQPAISVGYNSSNSNGLLGWGWQLSAGSVISRTGKNHLFDGEADPVTLNSSNDRLSLDGQRLVLYSGNNLADGSQYKTFIESYQRITKLASGGFLIEQKDGTKKLYGTTSASRVEINHNQTIVVMSWLIESIEDRNGNKIFYHYAKDLSKNQIRLNKISYTGGHDLTPKAEIEFNYTIRTDRVVRHIKGHTFTGDLLLENIRTTYEGVEYSKYQFVYSFMPGVTANDFSRLVEIKYWETGQNVNSTLIEWNYNGLEHKPTTSNAADFDQGVHGDVVFMDIDGDGIQDVLSLEYRKIFLGECDLGFDGQAPVNTEQHNFSIHANLVRQSGDIYQRSTVKNTFVSDYKPRGCYRNPFARIYAGDFNGDGLSDFLLHRAEGDDLNRYYIEVYINDRTSPGKFTRQYSRQISNHLPYDWFANSINPYKPKDHIYPPASDGEPFKGKHEPRNVPFEITVADFDGDGITDYTYPGATSTTSDPEYTYQTYWHVTFFNADLTTQNRSYKSPSRPQKTSIGSFTGDGIANLIILHNSGAEALKMDRTSAEKIIDVAFVDFTNFAAARDFDADGISDVLKKNSSNYELYLYDGLNFGSPTSIADSYYPSLKHHSFTDLDGDGRADILAVDDQEIYVHYNKITGWVKRSYSSPLYLTSGTSYKDFHFVYFNGQPTPQLFYCPHISTSPGNNFMISFKLGGMSKYIYQISDGFDRLTEFEFRSLCNAEYQRNFYAYPNPSISGNMQVFNHLKQWNFHNQSYTSQYFKYNSLRVNSRGLGFLGFESIITQDFIKDLEYEQTYGFISSTLGTQSHLFLPTSSSSRTLVAFNPVSIESQQITYVATNTLNNFSNGNWNFATPELLKKQSIDHLALVSTEETGFAYDNSNNITAVTKKIYPNISFSGTPQILQSTITSYTNGGNWINWLPSSSINTTTRDGQPAVSITTNYEYYSSGNLKKKTYRPQTTALVITDYEYDGFGNLTKTTVNPVGMTSRVYLQTWTPDYRFIESETNPLNWTTTYTYNTPSGTLKKTKFYDVETDYEYDNFGRLTKTTFPEGTPRNFQTITYNWDVGSTYSKALYYIEGSASFCGEELISCKDFFHSKEEQRYVSNSTQISPEQLDLCIERLGMGISTSVVKEV